MDVERFLHDFSDNIPRTHNLCLNLSSLNKLIDQYQFFIFKFFKIIWS